MSQPDTTNTTPTKQQMEGPVEKSGRRAPKRASGRPGLQLAVSEPVLLALFSGRVLTERVLIALFAAIVASCGASVLLQRPSPEPAGGQQ
jgi:hypothetical protein